MASKAEMEVQVKSSADRVWAAISDFNSLFPKIFPNKFKSVEILEGDGKTVGSVRLLTLGEGYPLLKTAKEKIEIADEANKTAGYSVIGGELMSYYKSFKATYQVVPKGEGCVVKGSFEYEKVSEEVPEPDFIKEIGIQTYNDLDAYLLINN